MFFKFYFIVPTELEPFHHAYFQKRVFTKMHTAMQHGNYEKNKGPSPNSFLKKLRVSVKILA